MKLSNHKVLITGGSVGIGYALAKAFHARGNHIMICARREGPLREAAASLPGVHAVECNVASERDLHRLVDEAKKHLGGLSILVNNAGLQRNDRYGETDQQTVLAHIDEEIGTNLTGLTKLTVLALPLLQKVEEAAILNVSSVLAIAPKQSAPIYCGTKAAVHSFTKALRYQLEAGSSNISVFEVLPPMVDTAMTAGRGKRKMSPDALAAAVLEHMAIGRLEIRPGFTRAFSLLYRVSPAIAHRLLKRR